jgi:hypothetical protein
MRRKNPEHYRVYDKQLRRKMRSDCVKGYGGECSCCGLDIEYLLEFDHKKPLGGKNRIHKTAEMCRRLIKDGFPDHMQLLCSNCHTHKTQFIDKGINKECPCGKIKLNMKRQFTDSVIDVLRKEKERWNSGESYYYNVTEALDNVESRLLKELYFLRRKE